MSTIPIVPTLQSTVATSVTITIPSFELHATETDVYATLQDSSGRYVDRKVVHIPPEIYAGWGTDDTYIEEYVLAELGLVKQDTPQ